MPRIWADTIDTHRQQVHDAILDATAELIAEHGPLSVAMSAIAEQAGIGRATLYKYFPDVGSILVAWHTRDFEHHLARLRALGDDHTATLRDVADLILEIRAHHRHGRADVVGALAHTVVGVEQVMNDTAWGQVVEALTQLMTGLAQRKSVRSDHDPQLLARWLLHTVHAPTELDDHAVANLIVDSLTPPHPRGRR
ncbi:MAG TPA: helix-turn-helix domain-containing protein [Acidimicrobiales bacterium]|nr:helix-turn-helix domain-containing protein [Acidimicrobiales bacterium]